MRSRALILAACAATCAGMVSVAMSDKAVSATVASYTKPVVTAVLASDGSTVGRTPVTLTGRRFEHVSSVTFGKAEGVGLHVVSSRRLIVYTPGHVHGTVPVTVHAKAGSSPANGRARFTFVHAGGVGSWSGSAAPVPSGTRTMNAHLTGTSCPTTTICYSIGYVVYPSYATRAFQQYRSGSYRSSHFLPLPHGADPKSDSVPTAIDCPAVANCAAVTHNSKDTNLLSLHNGLFTAVPATPPGGAITQTMVVIGHLSCGAPGECVAIGVLTGDDFDSYRALIFRLHDGSWTSSYLPVPVTSRSITEDISCPTASYCGAYVDESAQKYFLAVSDSGVTVRQLAAPPAGAGDDSLASIDCPEARQCALTDSTTSYILRTNGQSDIYHLVHTPPDAASSTFLPYAGGARSHLTCPSVTTCFVPTEYSVVSGGGRSAVARLRGNTVTVYPMPETSVTNYRTSLIAMSCARVDYCVAVGGRGKQIANRFGTYDVFDNGVWTPGEFASVAGQPRPSDLDLSDVDCAAAQACFVTGDYDYDFRPDVFGDNYYARAQPVTITQH